MRQTLAFIGFLCSALSASAQGLSLDSCKAMALSNNRQLAVCNVQKDLTKNIRKAARTKYLPSVNAIGGYEWISKEISLLNNDQKAFFNNIGTNIIGGASQPLTEIITGMVQKQIISPEAAMHIQQQFQEKAGGLAQAGNQAGESVTNAFRTDTRNIWAGSIMVTQPLYMGGAITAMNNIADIQENVVNNKMDKTLHETLYQVENTYWLIVSLRHKYELAKNFNKLVVHLNDDVQKMINEGVATKADGLKVAVKVNESEISLTQAENGIALAKMLLCQQCGIPLDSEITLADETTDNLALVENVSDINVHDAIDNRPETRLLEDAISMTHEVTRLTRAASLPQAALVGGYMVTNPNIYDGYRNKFGGAWNIGVMLRVPVWNWFEGAYKIRASKAATTMAEIELAEAKELMELQINQSRFKLNEANKRLAMANKNIKSAEENLRCATLGFKEGVMTSTEVIAAQTAWFQAQSQKIDAEIDVKMSQMAFKKSLGKL